MIIIKNAIYFKSDEGNYWKEFTGSKANTIRKIPDNEFCEFGLCLDPRGFLKSFDSIITRIVIGHGDRSFDRRLTDVSEFEGYFIFLGIG